MTTIYRVGTADCPWHCQDQLPGAGRGATKHYKTMTTDAIANMPYERTASFQFPTFTDDALLGMWRLGAMVDDALFILQQWKFKSKSELMWVKYRPCPACRGTGWQIDKHGKPMSYARKLGRCWVCGDRKFGSGRGCGTQWFGMGRYTRNAHEVCILATRGKMASKIRDHSIPSVLHAPMPWNWDTKRPIHSAKPEIFYELMERLARGPYVEMFGRRRRPGWTVLGNQVGAAVRRLA